MLGRSRSDCSAPDPCRDGATAAAARPLFGIPLRFFWIYLPTCVGSSAAERHNEMQMSGKSSATEKRKFSFLRCASDDRLGVNLVRWGEEKGKKGAVGGVEVVRRHWTVCRDQENILLAGGGGRGRGYCCRVSEDESES